MSNGDDPVVDTRPDGTKIHESGATTTPQGEYIPVEDDEDKGESTAREQAIDLIKRLAAPFGPEVQKRAAAILSSRLLGSSQEAVDSVWLSELVEGESLAGETALRLVGASQQEIANVWLSELVEVKNLAGEILDQAVQEQRVRSAGDAVKTFRDEYDRIFLEPLRQQRALSANPREKALIDTALELLEEEFVKHAGDYDVFLSTIAETLTPETIRIGPVEFFRDKAFTIVGQTLPELDVADLHELQETVAASYLQRAKEIDAEEQARSAFVARVGVFARALDRLRNDTALEQEDRGRLSRAFQEINEGLADAEDRWIDAGAQDLELASNLYVTRAIQDATVLTPLGRQVVVGDASLTLNNLQSATSREEAISRVTGMPVGAQGQAADIQEQRQIAARPDAPPGLEAALDPEAVADPRAAAQRAALERDAAILGVSVEEVVDFVVGRRVAQAEREQAGEAEQKISEFLVPEITRRLQARKPFNPFEGTGLVAEGFISGGNVPIIGGALTSVRIRSAFGERSGDAAMALQAAGLREEMPAQQQAVLIQDVVNKEVERQQAEFADVVRTETETGFDFPTAQRLRTLAQRSTTPDFTDEDRAEFEELQSRSANNVAPSAPFAPPSTSRERRGESAVRRL